MDYEEQLIDTSDARVLEVATMGDPSGRTVFYHHGSPGSAPLLKSLAPIVEMGRFYFVTMSRPGYGDSTRLEGRSAAAVVNDVRCVLDALGRDDYLSVGWSGGGPHSLACAALDAPRCAAAWSVAGVVPIDADFDWTDGMAEENLEEFAMARAGGPEYEGFLAGLGEHFASATSDNIVELFGGLLSEVDKAALADDDARESLAVSTRHAFANGWHGFYDDDRVFMSPWGFDPASITVPVSVWYGDQDLMVPPTHGAWLGEHLATATLHHYPDEGHVSIVANHLGEFASDLAAHG